jgi:hypothetical protein
MTGEKVETSPGTRTDRLAPGPRQALGGSGKAGAFLSFVLASALVLAISLAISWPLWALATGNRGAYTAAIGAAILAFAVAAAISRLRARMRGKGRSASGSQGPGESA